MNPDDYQKVKEIFQFVLELSHEERAAQLEARCPDSTVRGEVERLLKSYDSEYLEGPPAGAIADKISVDALSPGQQIGHYNVVRKIGSGGMGEVYLAEDGKLGRQVAIKLLPEIFTGDPDRLNRFQREARAASSLNHPNILTIHEIGETEGSHYIATEYVDGETLRAKLDRGKLPIAEALDIAVQCASALTAAHENGIIHRDIKPENIMLRRDNLVKVLDFGLAKLIEKKSASVNDNALTEKHVMTEPGVIMGTVQYMSPEQTRGHSTDGRTDIWSLGCVIYEMVAGQPPFAGGNSADLIAEIVKSHPPHVPHAPERLDEILSKTLEKSADERYQTAKDLLIDLKRLKRRLDLENEVERAPSPATGSSNAAFYRDNKSRITRADSTGTDVHALSTVSSAEYIVSARNFARTVMVSVITLTVIGVAGYGVYQWSIGRRQSNSLIDYASKIKLAAQALNASNYSQAKQLLDETKPASGGTDMRGFEWGYLANALSEAEASQPLLIKHGGVNAAAFSPDGKTLATGGMDNVVRVWDLNTGSEVRPFPGHTAMVTFVEFSPDGRTLLTTGFDGTARAWDVATGKTLFSLPETRGIARFSNDGNAVVVPNGRDIVFFNSVTGIEQRRFTSPTEPGAFLFSPGGKYLAVRGHDQTIYILNIANKRSVSTIKGHSDWVMDFEFSPDSNVLVTASKDKTAKLWDVRSGQELRALKGHDGEIYEVEFSPDGTTIATGSNDQTTRLWDVAKGFEITRLRSHTGNGYALAYSADGRKLASGGDNVLRVWNASGLRGRGVLRGHSGPVTGINFSPSGRLLLSSSGDKTARVWDIESERELISLGSHNSKVNKAIFSADGGRIATTSEDKMIKLWDSKTALELLSMDSPVVASELAMSRDGKLLATGHLFHDPLIRFWDLTSGKLVCETANAHEGGPWSIGFTADDRLVSSSLGEGTILLWEPSTCTQKMSFKNDQDVGNTLWFGPDNSWRAFRILNDGRSLTWFEPETGRELATFSGHDAVLSGAAFSSDAKRLITADEGGMIRIWDSATGLELLSFAAIVGEVNLALSPDGNTLAMGGDDGTIRLFRSSFAE